MDVYDLAAVGIVVAGVLALVWLTISTVGKLALGLSRPRPVPPPTPCLPTHTLDPADESTQIEWPTREEK